MGKATCPNWSVQMHPRDFPWYVGQRSEGKGQRGGRGERLCVPGCKFVLHVLWTRMEPPAKGHGGWPVNFQSSLPAHIYLNLLLSQTLPLKHFRYFLQRMDGHGFPKFTAEWMGEWRNDPFPISWFPSAPFLMIDVLLTNGRPCFCPTHLIFPWFK